LNPAAPKPSALDIDMDADTVGPSPWALWLGWAGLVPFVGLTAVLWFAGPGPRALAGSALLGYGAVILSFLGAIHWGLAMREWRAQPAAHLLWGIVPSLAGWVAMLVGHASGLLVIAIGLWSCFAMDRVLYERCRLRAWLPLRLWLTLVASASCLASAAAMLR
jgi:hypothetical protein